MMTKLTAVMMLALLALPSCCCLKPQDTEDCDVGEESCCASVDESLPTPAEPLVPSKNLPDPCDCEMSITQVLGLPENEFLKVEASENDYSTDWIEIQELTIADNDAEVILPTANLLSAFHSPNRRVCQDYCVYRI